MLLASLHTQHTTTNKETPALSTRRNRYEMTYQRIEDLLGRPLTELKPCDTFRLKARGFMDLTVEVLLPCDETGAPVLSLWPSRPGGVTTPWPL